MVNTIIVNNTKNLLFIVLTVSNLVILQFGHIAKHCFRISLCHNCGNEKHQNNTCCNPSFCVKCNKEGHPSTSGDCLTFLSKKSIF